MESLSRSGASPRPACRYASGHRGSSSRRASAASAEICARSCVQAAEAPLRRAGRRCSATARLLRRRGRPRSRTGATSTRLASPVLTVGRRPILATPRTRRPSGSATDDGIDAPRRLQMPAERRRWRWESRSCGRARRRARRCRVIAQCAAQLGGRPLGVAVLQRAADAARGDRAGLVGERRRPRSARCPAPRRARSGTRHRRRGGGRRRSPGRRRGARRRCPGAAPRRRRRRRSSG